MAENIDYFSINDHFWIHFKSHLVTFGFKGLPASTHFTLVFDDRSSDINFHVTKNTIDQNDKPHIKIFVIEKNIFEEIGEQIPKLFLSTFLKPIDIVELKAKHENNLGYISLDKNQNPDLSSLVGENLTSILKDLSHIKRKTRLKIKGDIISPLEKLVTSKEVQNSFLENIIEIPDQMEDIIESGIILKEGSYTQIMRIFGKWYEIRTDIKPFDILSAIVDPKISRLLVWKTMRALILVKQANNYSDTKKFNNPVRLILRKTNKD